LHLLIFKLPLPRINYYAKNKNYYSNIIKLLFVLQCYKLLCPQRPFVLGVPNPDSLSAVANPQSLTTVYSLYHCRPVIASKTTGGRVWGGGSPLYRIKIIILKITIIILILLHYYLFYNVTNLLCPHPKPHFCFRGPDSLSAVANP